MECGGSPPPSPKLKVRQQNAPGEACLARLVREFPISPHRKNHSPRVFHRSAVCICLPTAIQV